MLKFDSKDIAKAAIKIALTDTRDDEKNLKQHYLGKGIKVAAVDFGGEFVSSMSKIIERAVVAAKREGLIEESHSEEGAVAGAAREALSQIINKAVGMNIGGKIGIARFGEHVGVAVFFGIGLLNLNEVAVGLGHRVV